MKLELETYGSFCCTSLFIINGIEADARDFGEKYDHDSENADEYGCGDMKFVGSEPTEKVLKKYGITVPEYNLIVGQLEVSLSFGRCGWCI